MKKILLSLLVITFLIIAYASKPDDKTCIIQSVNFVWGRWTPTTEKPLYYNQFMDFTSKSVVIKDWVFFKQIKYKFTKGEQTVALGAFKRVFPFHPGF